NKKGCLTRKQGVDKVLLWDDNGQIVMQDYHRWNVDGNYRTTQRYYLGMSVPNIEHNLRLFGIAVRELRNHVL
ncbi:hypothetical protein, partial [Staphylococcus aureus]